MTEITSKYADFEGLRKQATALRREGLTTRRNTAETYRGCLIIYVTKSTDLYRRVEGTWYGIVLGAARSVS